MSLTRSLACEGVDGDRRGNLPRADPAAAGRQLQFASFDGYDIYKLLQALSHVSTHSLGPFTIPGIFPANHSSPLMSVYHNFVNPARRQYFDPLAFGESNSYPFQPHSTGDGKCLHACALAMLMIDPSRCNLPFYGAWSGDAVFIASDCGGPDKSGCEFGVYTATPDDPGRPLYIMAIQEYRDISVEIVETLCEWDDRHLVTLVSRAVSGIKEGGSRFTKPLCNALIPILSRDSMAETDFRSIYDAAADDILAQMREYVARRY